VLMTKVRAFAAAAATVGIAGSLLAFTTAAYAEVTDAPASQPLGVSANG
jgi:hypothetical protein